MLAWGAMPRVLAIGLVLLVASRADANPYETFIDVDDEADLQDLLSAQDITQDTFDELLDLLERGTDLDEADRNELYALPNLTYEDVDRILAYRDTQKGHIRDPADLVAAGAIPQEKLLGISAFLITRPAGQSPLAARGWVRGEARYTLRDKVAPPVALRGRITAMRHLTAGFAGLTDRNDIGDPVYDPNRNALVATRPGYNVVFPKAFVKWEDADMNLIAGSYRAGFAQRLVFDNSRGYSPNGLSLDDQIYYTADLSTGCRETAGETAVSPCTGAAGTRYQTPDFVYRDGLFGVAAGAKHVELGTGWMQAYLWASASRRSIYQYELYDRAKCKDPHDDKDPNCAAPPVYVRPDGDILTPTTAFSFETLPDVFQERLAGGEVAYYADRRDSVGLTAYGATEKPLTTGLDLDFQEWSRLPTGRSFGAAGANFSYGQGWLDVFGEAALSFDQQPNGPQANGGGGPAAILRVTATGHKEELEAVLRYYSTEYKNPYARPISQPDEFDGARARDEAGARLRYVRQAKNFNIRALLDMWVPPSTFDHATTPAGHTQPKIDTYVRTDVRTTDELRLGLWLRYQDKDLEQGGHDQCFESPLATTLTGAPVPCSGRQLTTIVRAHYMPDHSFEGTLMLEHQLLDDASLSKTSFRQDIAAWAIALWKPMPGLRLRGRVRYLDEAISDDTYLERSLAALVDAGITVRDRDLLRVRVDTKFWLDARASTMTRVPNPELTLWLSYEAHL